MDAERLRRKTLPSLRTSASQPTTCYDSATKENDFAETKRPRVFSKALRSLSNSSLDSASPATLKLSASVRRLQKAHSSGSASMIERIHRRVSKSSSISGSPPDSPGSPTVRPHALMEVLQSGLLKKGDVSLLKARAEYLVLTDQSLIKFSSLEAAKHVFPQLNHIGSPNPTGTTHSGGKMASGDLRIEIPLRSIVSVFTEEGSSPRFGIEIWWFSSLPKLAYCKTQFFFNLPKERDDWLADIQQACRIRLRRSPVNTVVPDNLKTRIQHIVETTEPTTTNKSTQNLTFPVAKRLLGVPQKASSPEETHSIVDGSSFYLVIGPSMCYFIEVLKADSTILPGDLRVKVQSFGTVTLTHFKASVASSEQRFVISFRQPFNREVRLELASIHYRRVIESLTKVDRILKPMCPQHLQQATFDIRGLPPPLHLTSGNDLGGLETSLRAYCAAFHVAMPRWMIEWNRPSQAAFRLLPSEETMYSPLQLLAVFRALRYNNFFKALSFRDVDLSALVGKRDFSHYGDAVVFTSLSGLTIPEEFGDDLLQAPILAQEMHALMFASESIRSVDLSNILGSRSPRSRLSRVSVDISSAQQLSSEVLRPILSLLRWQLCLCRSVTMRGNLLAGAEVDELANVLLLEHVSLRKLELANCGLGDAGLSKLWAGILGQSASLETLDTSENQGIVRFEVLRRSLNQLKIIRKLNISGNTRIGCPKSLFDEAVINSWALEELDLSGIALNDATVSVLAGYLATAKSLSLQVLKLNSCGLTGRQVALLFREMGQTRHMTVFINSNRLDEGIDDLCGAISCGYGPWSLFIQMLEFATEANYIKLMRALTVNKTIECLSLAGSATPDPASDVACQAVAEFFAKNDSVRFLDISGYDAKLDEGRLGRGFSKALSGLRENTRIEHLRVRSQMLNINIGDLAEAISANKTLHTLDCESNDFNLSNFRHLIRHLDDNVSIRYFSAFADRELSQTVDKSVNNIVSSATPSRRASVISRFRHEKPQAATGGPLGQQLKHEWDHAVEDLQRILDRNQTLFQNEEELRREPTPTFSKASDGESIFSNPFGGLALKAWYAQKRRDSTGSNTPQRSSTVSSASGTGRVQGRTIRSYSMASSEGGGSQTDGRSTGSAMPSPFELESSSDKDYKLEKSISTDSLQEELRAYNFMPSEGQDSELGLEMKPYRLHWSDQAGCIKEEEFSH